MPWLSSAGQPGEPLSPREGGLRPLAPRRRAGAAVGGPGVEVPQRWRGDQVGGPPAGGPGPPGPTLPVQSAQQGPQGASTAGSSPPAWGSHCLGGSRGHWGCGPRARTRCHAPVCQLSCTETLAQRSFLSVAHFPHFRVGPGPVLSCQGCFESKMCSFTWGAQSGDRRVAGARGCWRLLALLPPRHLPPGEPPTSTAAPKPNASRCSPASDLLAGSGIS